ncbi:MAG: hypothetical protein QG657_179 [Acidobacteriota bacterium]|nr:hypothetical protein [Acidobacteriota bacterium]
MFMLPGFDGFPGFVDRISHCQLFVAGDAEQAAARINKTVFADNQVFKTHFAGLFPFLFPWRCYARGGKASCPGRYGHVGQVMKPAGAGMVLLIEVREVFFDFFQEIFYELLPAGNFPEGEIDFDAQGKAFFDKRDDDGHGNGVLVFGVEADAKGKVSVSCQVFQLFFVMLEPGAGGEYFGVEFLLGGKGNSFL